MSEDKECLVKRATQLIQHQRLAGGSVRPFSSKKRVAFIEVRDLELFRMSNLVLERRRVSIKLIIGVVLIPIVFYWFLLGQGYSIKSRVFGALWLVLSLHLLALVPFFLYGFMMMY